MVQAIIVTQMNRSLEHEAEEIGDTGEEGEDF